MSQFNKKKVGGLTRKKSSLETSQFALLGKIMDRKLILFSWTFKEHFDENTGKK